MKIFAARRLCVLLFAVAAFASQSWASEECDEPRVKFGEVMAGLQAGFTGGTVNDNTLPSGFFMGVSGVDQRGFIDAETGSGWKCDDDWGLISGWLGARIGPLWWGGNRTRREALQVAETRIPVVRIEIDGEALEVVATNAKLGILPLQPPFNGGPAAMKSWGAFLEPNSLEPGLHTAVLIYGEDINCKPFPPASGGLCDGIPDMWWPYTVIFEVIVDED